MFDSPSPSSGVFSRSTTNSSSSLDDSLERNPPIKTVQVRPTKSLFVKSLLSRMGNSFKKEPKNVEVQEEVMSPAGTEDLDGSLVNALGAFSLSSPTPSSSPLASSYSDSVGTEHEISTSPQSIEEAGNSILCLSQEVDWEDEMEKDSVTWLANRRFSQPERGELVKKLGLLSQRYFVSILCYIKPVPTHSLILF